MKQSAFCNIKVILHSDYRIRRNALSLIGFIYAFIGAFASNDTIQGNSGEKVTIDRVLEQIMTNNPQLQITSAQIDAEVLSMKASNVPGATSVEYSPFFGGGNSGIASSELILKQSFEFPTLYASRAKATDARRAVLEGNLLTDARDVKLQALQACIDYIGVQKQNEILDQRIAVTDSIKRLYERKLQRGTATLLETNRIALTLQELQRERLSNKLAEAEAIAGLTILNGGTPIDVNGLDYDPRILFQLNVEADSTAFSRYVKSIVTVRPELKAADFEIKAAEQNLALAKSGWLPEISLGYRRNTDGNSAVNGFLVGLDFSLFSTGKESKVMQARKNLAEMQRETQLTLIEAETNSTLRQLQLMRSTLDATDTGLINETLALYARSLELGQITLTDFFQETDILYTRLSERAKIENEMYSLAAKLQ